MDTSTGLIVFALVVFVFVLGLSRSPKRITLRGAWESIQRDGLTFDEEMTASMGEENYPPEAEFRQAWLSNPQISLKYWRTLKEGSELETIDFIFKDFEGAGGVVMYFVDGRAVRKPGSTVPLSNPRLGYIAAQILKSVHDNLPDFYKQPSS